MLQVKDYRKVIYCGRTCLFYLTLKLICVLCSCLSVGFIFYSVYCFTTLQIHKINNLCLSESLYTVDSAGSVSKVSDDRGDEYRNAANDNTAEEGSDEDRVMDQQADSDVDTSQQQHGHSDNNFDDFYNGRNQKADLRPSRGHAATVDAAQSSNYRSIECLINNEYTVACRQDANGEVYLPFKFIGKYFEVPFD